MKLLHLAGQDDVGIVLGMGAAFHAELGIESEDSSRRAAVEPLLAGSPHGAIWLIGPRRAPVGYVAMSFGWSIEFGGMDGMVDEFFIRAPVRGRGMGRDALNSLCKALKDSGLVALHLEVAHSNARAEALYTQIGFRPETELRRMSRRL